MTETVGVIGIGALGEAIVHGLSTTAEPPTIWLSPRNEQTARTLADTYPNVRVCPNNQSVAACSDTIVLTVRPAHLVPVLEELTVPPNRVVISAVAGWSSRALHQHLAGAAHIVRAIPLPAVKEHRGITALFPAQPVAHDLFSRLGDVVITPSEESFNAVSAATATISSYLHYLATIADWLGQHGIDDRQADLLLRRIYLGVNANLRNDQQTLTDLRNAHETPAGINEQLRTTWFHPHNQTQLHDALSTIWRRVSTQHHHTGPRMT